MKRNVVVLLIVIFFANLQLSAFGDEGNKLTDYSKPENWLTLPVSVTKKVDIFYIYPTVWHKVDKKEPNFCEINNPTLQEGAKIALKIQAEAFAPVGNIYAPYYRQVDANYNLSQSLEQQDKNIAGIPSQDVFSAFDYYIKNYNNGRPFILASHSQGSAVAANLLERYMKVNPKVNKRMIAAYVIGFAVTEDYLKQNPHLKFAQGADDTGVIISYNTEAPIVCGINPLLRPNGISINPISWTRKETLASSEKNLGSLVFDEKGHFSTVKNFADARVDKKRGSVICSSVNQETLLPKIEHFPKGVYHSFDYQFYYYNLRENAKNRANIYLKNNKRY